MCSEGAESILDCDRSKREGNVQVLPYMNFTFTSWKHDNDLGVICKEKQSLPTRMLVVDVALSLLLIAFILLFAYLAYYCAKRGRRLRRPLHPNPDPPSSNDGYFTTIDAPKQEYSRCVVVDGKVSEEAEDIKMKDMTIVEDKVVHSYFTFT
ncbi:hypothetical protein BSL78_06788 [Apostichopus japonicus]|uniref:Uncharacterized protein n=1 Tax=Stichopus japonicus TaxID=307972 RepID=A0A2G8L7T7_STIJA|nr:hypothetical protein BSL78_06788 [Apostichopus japonicus]